MRGGRVPGRIGGTTTCVVFGEEFRQPDPGVERATPTWSVPSSVTVPISGNTSPTTWRGVRRWLLNLDPSPYVSSFRKNNTTEMVE